MALILTDEQKVGLTVSFTTAAGNAATVDGVPTWVSSDETILTVADIGADGMSCSILTVGPVGTAQVSVTADADMGEGTRQITGLLDIEVRAAEAVSANIAAGEPEVK